MDKYERKLDFDFSTNQRIIKLISQIDAYRGKWDAIEKKENKYLRELRRIATVESAGSSTRIEGSILTDEEIRKLLDNLKITELITRDQQEVIGYYDVLEIIFESYPDIDLSKNYIQQLHQLMLKFSIKDERHRGKYKSLPNKVVANYPDGTQKVVFNTTEPHLVENEMSELIDWTVMHLKSGKIHPLVVTGLFIYEFLSIHPFQDGNGRLSRLLTNLLLLQSGYRFVSYVSFESLIEQEKRSYYKALMEGQKNRVTGNECVNAWILFFLGSVEEMIKRLEKKYDVFRAKGGYLNERQKKIMEFIGEARLVRLGDLARAMPGISVNTLKKDLQSLKNQRLIDSAGKNRGTVYFKG